MNEPLQKMLTPQLQRWLRMIAARPSAVVGVCLTLTLALLIYAFFNLGINADNLSLVSKSLKSRQNHAAFAALFPNLEEAMLVVIDGETPALAREATDALALELESMGDTFRNVYVPGGGTFFEEHALLYRTPDELDEFADQLATLQPVLASLESDPSLVQLAELVRLGFESGNEAARALLTQDDPPTAIVASSDQMALATLDVARELGLSVPRDLSVISFDNITNQAILQNPPDAAVEPGTYLRMRWIDIADDASMPAPTPPITSPRWTRLTPPTPPSRRTWPPVAPVDPGPSTGWLPSS